MSLFSNVIISEKTQRILSDTYLQTAIDTKQTIIGDGDLSISNVDGLQTALDTKQTIIGDGDLSISKVDGLQTALDSLSGGGGGGGGGSSGVNLETIQEVCNGGTITTISGNTLTIPNITAVVKPNQVGGHTILASVPYQPPSGTKSVMLTLKFFIGWNGSSSSCDALFDCRVNGTSYDAGVITSQSYIKSGYGMGDIGEYEINCLMNVDASAPSDNLPNGIIKNWNTTYTFNFASSRIIQNSQVFLFSNKPHPYNTAIDGFIAPILIIKAFA